MPNRLDRGNRSPSWVLEAQQHGQHTFQLAVEMDLVAAEPLQLVRIERLAECLLPDERAVGQFLLTTLESREHLGLQETPKAVGIGSGGFLVVG